ncbi:MAG: hypothetical protein V3T28_02455, partial [Gemmatimonadales bacterium]
MTGAVSVTERGPSAGKPVLVTTYADFVRIFGGVLAEPPAAQVNRWALDHAEGGRWWQAALAVRGYFENGGQQLYFKRVTSSDAVAANATLGEGVTIEIVRDELPTATSIRLRNLIGIDVNSAINIFSDGIPLAGNPFPVTSYAATGVVQLNAPVNQAISSGRDWVEVVAFPRQAVANAQDQLRVEANSTGVWGGNPNIGPPGSGLSVRVRPMVGNTLRILADPALGGAPARTTVHTEALANDLVIRVVSNAGFNVNDTVLIAGRRYTVAATGAGPPEELTIADAAGNGVPPNTTWPVGTPMERLRPANDPQLAPGASVRLQGASQLYPGALVARDTTVTKEVHTVTAVDGEL